MMIAVLVFRQWTSMGQNVIGFPTKLVFWSLGAILVVMEILAGNARANYGNGVWFSVISAIIYIPIVIVSAVLFIWKGSHFYKELQGLLDHPGKRIALQRATRWLIISSVAEVIVLVAVLFFAISELSYTPWGMFGVYISLEFGLSLVSLSHVLAFTRRKQKKTQAMRSSVHAQPKHEQAALVTVGV
eukprot:c8239_g1_i1.p1 GENE.c8239_g1_i1~~c8239_g1_i1.p1  ORF type:complete len:187 (-),score=22.19 c8239_g1_i1:94-654(-)